MVRTYGIVVTSDVDGEPTAGVAASRLGRSTLGIVGTLADVKWRHCTIPLFFETPVRHRRRRNHHRLQRVTISSKYICSP